MDQAAAIPYSVHNLCCREHHHIRLQAAHYSGWRSPLPLSDCEDQEDAGGQRQDGGAWGRTEEEDSRQIFLPSHNKLSKRPCVPWIGSWLVWFPNPLAAGSQMGTLSSSWQAVPLFGRGEEEGFIVESESFITKIVYIVDSVVGFCQKCLIRPRWRKYSRDE